MKEREEGKSSSFVGHDSLSLSLSLSWRGVRPESKERRDFSDCTVRSVSSSTYHCLQSIRWTFERFRDSLRLPSGRGERETKQKRQQTHSAPNPSRATDRESPSLLFSSHCSGFVIATTQDDDEPAGGHHRPAERGGGGDDHGHGHGGGHQEGQDERQGRHLPAVLLWGTASGKGRMTSLFQTVQKGQNSILYYFLRMSPQIVPNKFQNDWHAC